MIREALFIKGHTAIVQRIGTIGASLIERFLAAGKFVVEKEGSVANSELELGSVTVEIHADHPVQSLQRPPLPGRGDCSVRPLVPTHVAELLAERGVEVDPSCIWRWVHGSSRSISMSTGRTRG